MKRRTFLTYSIVLFIFLFTTQNIFSQFRINFEPQESQISVELKSKIQTKLLEEFQLIMSQNRNSIQAISLGQVDSVFYAAWDFAKPNNQVTDVVEKRKLYGYDSYTNTRSEIEADFNTSTGKYENATKLEIEYSPDAFDISKNEKMFNWDANQNDWVPVSEHEYVYGEGTESDTYYEYENGQKVPVSRESREYGDNHNPKYDYFEVYENGSWKNTHRITYVYDIFGLVEEIEQIWNTNTNDWENLEKEEKSYNEKGQEESFTTSIWDGSAWQNEMYGEHDYNQDDNLSRTTISYWNGMDWDYIARTIYSYLDPSGIIQSLIDMYWDSGQDMWQSDWRTYYSYNNDYQMTEDLLQQWNGSDWDYYSRDQYNYDANGNCVGGNADMYYQGNWEDTYHPLGFKDGYGLYHYFLCSYFNAYFSQLTDVEEDELQNNFRLTQNYPNPFNPATTIKFTIPSNVKRETSNIKLVVYNILGQQVKILVNEVKTPGIYNVTFDASNLPSGVYFYTLESGDDRLTKKMIFIK